MRIKSPLDVGDIVKFRSSGSGYKKGARCKVTAIGYDQEDHRTGKGAWRVKIDIDKRDWWSMVWFVKVNK